MNFLTIKKKHREAIGVIISDENNRTFNIEYNLIN